MAYAHNNECAQYLDKLIDDFEVYRVMSGLSEKAALRRFIGALGYKELGPKRKVDQEICLTPQLLEFIKDEEKKIELKYSNQLEKDNIKKRHSITQYIIIETLQTFNCKDCEGKRMCEKQIADKLDYCPRTIRNYRNVHRRSFVSDTESPEHKAYCYLRKVIEEYT